MCIVVYKPKGTKMPSKNILKTCFENNNDGVGFMSIGNECHIKKGFMSFKSFWKAFCQERYGKDDEIAIHFRIGTSGKMNETATHPFPITEDENKITSLKITTNKAVMHNGILGKGEGDFSDTMLFTKNVLALISDYLDDENIIKAIENMTDGSRLLIVDDGKVHLTGTWLEVKGIYYSNDTYKESRRVPAFTSKSNTHKNWDFYSEYSTYKYLDEVDPLSEEDEVEDESFYHCPVCQEIDQIDPVIGVDKDAYILDADFICLTCETVFNKEGEYYGVMV